MRIAVAGGTGTVGRYVVQAAEQSGHHVVVLSRRAGIDLQNGGEPPAVLKVDAGPSAENDDMMPRLLRGLHNVSAHCSSTTGNRDPHDNLLIFRCILS